MKQNLKLILGSKSPRRQQLLKEGGYIFEIRTQDDEEDFDTDIPVSEVAAMLAIRKSEALRPTILHNELLLTADSVVILDNMIYNKPKDYADGVRILKLLAGKTHTVATGVCLYTKKETKAFTVFTNVTFDNITDTEIDYYLTHHKPYDKAGAYGIQDWIGLCKVISIEGSYSNIMGLPMREVYLAIKTMDI